MITSNVLLHVYGCCANGFHSNLTLHRADYQKILYDAAWKAGASISFGKKVVSIDTSTPSLTLQDGAIIRSDLIVAADGTPSVESERMWLDCV